MKRPKIQLIRGGDTETLQGYIYELWSFADHLEFKNKELIDIGNRLVDHISGGKYITDAEWMKVAELFKNNKK
jgi:hypothetical protein